jgi:hypothetical protein
MRVEYHPQEADDPNEVIAHEHQGQAAFPTEFSHLKFESWCLSRLKHATRRLIELDEESPDERGLMRPLGLRFSETVLDRNSPQCQQPQGE